MNQSFEQTFAAALSQSLTGGTPSSFSSAHSADGTGAFMSGALDQLGLGIANGGNMHGAGSVNGMGAGGAGGGGGDFSQSFDGQSFSPTGPSSMGHAGGAGPLGSSNGGPSAFGAMDPSSIDWSSFENLANDPSLDLSNLPLHPNVLQSLANLGGPLAHNTNGRPIPSSSSAGRSSHSRQSSRSNTNAQPFPYGPGKSPAYHSQPHSPAIPSSSVAGGSTPSLLTMRMQQSQAPGSGSSSPQVSTSPTTNPPAHLPSHLGQPSMATVLPTPPHSLGSGGLRQSGSNRSSEIGSSADGVSPGFSHPFRLRRLIRTKASG